MKTIDLLNKIANGEEVPKKVKYDGVIFKNKDGDLLNDINCSLFEHRGNECEKLLPMLNDEVEIIEEERKIPEKLENEHEFYSYVKYEENKDEIDKVVYILKAINLAEEKIDNLNNSINSIIDYLKSKGDE